MNSNNLLACAAVLALAGSANADLLMTEVVDATLPGGLPKFVELTNTGASIVDLSLYSFGNFSNGATTLGGGAASVLTGTLAPGASYIVCYEADNGPGGSAYFAAYGSDPDFYMGGAFVNGDDTLALFLGAAVGDGLNATLVDVYGDVGVDGTGTVWEYMDSYAYRCNTTANNGTFNPAEWTFGGANALEAGCGGDDTCELANLLALTTPGVNAGCGGGPVGTPFCFGDGTGPACPCANFGAAGEGCANSSGAGALMSGSGTVVAANNDLVLNASQLPNGVPALFFSGPANTGGIVFGDGLRCAGGALTRLEIVFADGSGNAASSVGIASKIGATTGTQSYMQLWYRDPSGPCGGQFNVTNALDVLWQ